jgi:hypothetical protein
MSFLSSVRQKLGRRLATYLSKPIKENIHMSTCEPECLAATIRKGDILLVEGVSRFSSAIKYITQSTWSHATLCVSTDKGQELVEADVLGGVQIISLDNYSQCHTRICRPVGLTEVEINVLVEHALAQVGHQYDLKHIFDLARFLIQAPPVPVKMRRRLLSIGSGDPTRAICSSLVAKAFQSVNYPILPEIEIKDDSNRAHLNFKKECYHIRHHSLFAPRDFDISPYFKIIKPTLERGFDPHKFNWAHQLTDSLN